MSAMLVALAWRALMPEGADRSSFEPQETTILMLRPSTTASANALRPLFATREAASEGADIATGFTLIGVAGRLPDDAQALIRLPGGRTATLSRGGNIDGWKLISLAADRVVLENAGEQAILTMSQ
ncbi:hypothetical protein [Tsuneonella sp. HG222]